MNRGCRNALILGMVLFVTLGITGLIIFAATQGGGLGVSGDALALVQIRGGIFEADAFIDEIDEYRKNDSVKALIVRVDSPGGGVGASQEIFHELSKFRDDGKLVVVSMGAVAASGGYYVACAGDRIFALPGTITGSIGVISTFPNLEGLNEKVGLQWTVLKTGAYKDSGSSSRPMTDADRAVMEELLFSAYDQFVGDIAERRGMEFEDVKTLADGRVYTGRQAMEHGLIDEEGSLLDAIEYARVRTGIEGEPHILQREEQEWPWFLAASVDDILPEAARSMRPGLYYLWP